MLARIAFAFLVVVALAFSASAPPDASPLPPEISFTVMLAGQYSSTAACVGAGTALSSARRLTNIGAYGGAAWSPDGSQVAIAGGKRVTGRIQVERSDGTGLHPVTFPRLKTEQDSSAAWSPDGTRILFSRYVYYGPGTDYKRAGVWIVDLRTRRERQLTRESGSAVWAPTGDEIAVDLGSDVGEKFVFLTPGGQVLRRIKVGTLGQFDQGASWSPDGTKLAVGGGAIVDRSGQIVGRYAPPSTDDVVSRLPAWSPDGSTIVFVRAATSYNARVNFRTLGRGDIWLAPAAGGTAVPLWRTPSIDEYAPRWRPGTAALTAGTSQPCIVQGTSNRDVIRGTTRDDMVDTGGGNDSVDGRGGDDLIAGGPGADSLRGGPGRDVLLGGTGNDRLLARDGRRDRIDGNQGRDWATVDSKDTVARVEIVRR